MQWLTARSSTHSVGATAAQTMQRCSKYVYRGKWIVVFCFNAETH